MPSDFGHININVQTRTENVSVKVWPRFYYHEIIRYQNKKKTMR